MLSLGFIEKVHLTFGSGAHSHRKAGFRWISAAEKEKEDGNVSDLTLSTPKKETNETELVESECQTSPGLLRSLIKDINAELEEAKT